MFKIIGTRALGDLRAEARQVPALRERTEAAAEACRRAAEQADIASRSAAQARAEAAVMRDQAAAMHRALAAVLVDMRRPAGPPPDRAASPDAIRAARSFAIETAAKMRISREVDDLLATARKVEEFLKVGYGDAADLEARMQAVRHAMEYGNCYEYRFAEDAGPFYRMLTGKDTAPGGER